jgi:RNA polymerase sigma-54 factor
MQKVGQERFEECFLRDEAMTDADRARLCKISSEEAAKLRELVNGLYIQAEFDGSASEAAPSKVYSAVAGVMVDGGRAELSFFNREIWKGHYRIDEQRRQMLLEAMPAAEAKRADRILRDLEFLDRRKTTLYRLLEVLIKAQVRFFVSGDPGQREPLTQRAVSEKLEMLPSVFNRLISNKSIELPWGLETPLKTLFPSRKSMLLDRLHELIREHPSSTDEELRALIARIYGAKLSCRSIAQYRAELGLGTSRTRR